MMTIYFKGETTLKVEGKDTLAIYENDKRVAVFINQRGWILSGGADNGKQERDSE